MKTSNGIIHAYSIDGSGSGSVLEGNDITEAVASEQLTWVHLDATEEHSKTWLKEELKFLDSIIVEALVADESRPRILQFDQGTLLILRGVNLNADARP